MKSVAQDKTLLNSYFDYDLKLRVERLRIGLTLGIVFLALFGILDFVVYREVWGVLVFARIVSILILLVLFYFINKSFLKSIRLLGVVWAVVLFLSMDSLIILTDGIFSSYYGGLMLVMVALTVLMPWTIIETVIMCVLMVLLYLFAVYFHAYLNLIRMNYINLIGSLFFLGGTSIICVTASYYNTKLRFKEFCSNYELEKKNNELFQINKIRTEFFANISHEFRTPLTLILGPVKNIMDDKKSEFSSFVKENLNIVKDNGFRLLKLVNDLLDVISLENGQVGLKMAKIEVNEFIGSRVDEMSYMAELKDIKLVKNLSKDKIFIKADENALDKIIINLINNAIKFTPKDGSVEVLTRVEKDKLIIEVVDNGIGIKKKDLAFIFDRFKQVDGSSTRKFQGTGLGLALVKELTQAQGGTIVVDSIFNKGTAFSLSFTIDNSDHEVRKCDSDKEKDGLFWIQKTLNSSTGISTDLENGILGNVNDCDEANKRDTRILVVDDEPDILRFIARTLNMDGYEILIAQDGKEAIRVAKKEVPDVVLLDLMLPNIDGLEVCKILKEDKKLEFVKVILLTAKADEESKIQALKNGADDFMIKPFSKDELLLRISNLSKVGKLQTILNQDLLASKNDLKESLEEVRDSQRKLIQSEKLNSIGTLSAGVIHEVNNPLNYTLDALRFLKSNSLTTENEDIREIINDIEDGMERINQIVGEFKDFVCLDKDREQKEFLICDAVDSALKFTAYDCSGIEVKNNVDSSIMTFGSINHIVQVLINLISNAGRAIEKLDSSRKGIIYVGSEVIDSRVRIFVKDNGIGMNDEDLNKVFDSFYTTSDSGKGMGLGLNICNTMIKNHGGSFEVKTELGEGSTFSFDLAARK